MTKKTDFVIVKMQPFRKDTAKIRGKNMEKKIDPEIYVYKDLREKILVGELKNGDRLVETTLAKQYDVSRLHIKSALRFLEQEHLAEHIPMCGFQVVEFTEEAMEEIEELRLALDCVTFAHFAKIATKEDIACLWKMAQRISVFFQNNMVEDAMEELDLFYSFVYDKSGYIHITAILDKYSDYFKIIRRKCTSDMEVNIQAATLLSQIVAAVEQKDIDTLSIKLGQR